MTKQKEIYPKVAAKGKVKACNKKKGCTDLKFDDLNFTGDQFERLCDWVDEGIEVLITIQQVEGMLIDIAPTENQRSMADQIAAEEIEHDKTAPKDRKKK